MVKKDMIYSFKVKAGGGAKVIAALSKLPIAGAITVRLVEPAKRKRRKSKKKKA